MALLRILPSVVMGHEFALDDPVAPVGALAEILGRAELTGLVELVGRRVDRRDRGRCRVGCGPRWRR